MQIIDGYVGVPNIYADVIGEHNISMYGSGDYVLNVGECLGYELISNNEIRIKDGMFITQGRRGYIKKGTTEVCRIDNGAQSGKRNDLIVIEYAKDLSTQVESHTIRVLKGIPGAEASDPEIATGSIPDGAILHQMPLYRVKIEGLSVATIEQMFEFGSVAAETVNPMLATEEGFPADAKLTRDAIDELNSNLGGFTPIIDDTGKITGYKTNVGGADTVFPFKGGEISVASLIIGKYAGGDSVSTHASTNNTEIFTAKPAESASTGYITVNKDCTVKLFTIAAQKGASASATVKLNGTTIVSGSAYTNGYKQDINLAAGDKLTATVSKPDTTYAAFGFYIVCI